MPAEIEAYLCKHSDIKEAAVVGVPDETLGNRICAFILTEKGNALDVQAVHQFLKEIGVASYKLPDQVEMLLNNKNRIQKFANRYLAAKDVFFIGRGIDYAISLEGSLKLKEISYIHSEAYAAGELKHGTISLIEEGRLWRQC